MVQIINMTDIKLNETYNILKNVSYTEERGSIIMKGNITNMYVDIQALSKLSSKCGLVKQLKKYIAGEKLPTRMSENKQQQN